MIAVEQLVNPRLRDEIGAIHLVPPEERISGPGASLVMAAFTHINPQGSRFSDGSYGVYYAAQSLTTAIVETTFHFARYAADSHDGPRREDMRVLVGRIDSTLIDVNSVTEDLRAQILDAHTYSHSQPFAAKRREEGANGLIYRSVRHLGGQCIGAFRPRAVGIPRADKHLQYEWDGHRVTRYFDYETDTWHIVPST